MTTWWALDRIRHLMKSKLQGSTVCLHVAKLVNKCVAKSLLQTVDYIQSRSAGQSLEPSFMETEVLSVFNNRSPDDEGIEFITAVSVHIGSSVVLRRVILYTGADVMEEYAASIHPKTETTGFSSVLKSVFQTTGPYS